MTKILCRDCARWYSATKADQCVVPSCDVPSNTFLQSNSQYQQAVHGRLVGPDIDTQGAAFLKSKMRFINYCGDNMVYGHPSELNVNNDCYFFKPKLRFRLKKFMLSLMKKS